MYNSKHTRELLQIVFLSLLLLVLYYIQNHTASIKNITQYFKGNQVKQTYQVQKVQPFYNSLQCDNILSNLTKGKWVKKISFMPDNTSEEYKNMIMLEEEMDEHLRKFRIDRGIHTKLWRDDQKCGYANEQTQPTESKFRHSAAGWCDPKGNRPCCTSEIDGVCRPASKQSCGCEKCVHMRRLIHAEVSEWVPEDSRCRRHNYSKSQACEVLSKFKKIYFLGDSIGRKACRGLALTLGPDPEYGLELKRYSQQEKMLCVGFDQFYWKECRLGVGLITEQIVDTTMLCEGKMGFEIDHKLMYGHEGKRVLEFLRKLIGKPGTVIFCYVGLHFGCDADHAINNILSPVADFFNEHYKTSAEFRWPHFVFSPPDAPGFLKAPHWHSTQGTKVCKNYTDTVTKFCSLRNIPVLDFWEMTFPLHSPDGTHYGMGTNLMKAQIMLSYLDSLNF